MPTFRAPRGTRDLLPAERPRYARLERDRRASSPARYGYRPIETPLFEQTAVFERGVGEVTDVVEKELFRLAAADRGGRALGAPPGADRRHRPGLRPARDADAAAAGEADADRADVPLRPAPGRPLPPVLAVRRRGDRRPGPGRRRRDHRARARGSTATPGSRDVVVQLNSIGDAVCRPAYIEELDGVLPRPHADALPPLERDRLETQPAPAARLEGPGDGRAERGARRGSPTGCATPAPAHFAGVRAHLDALGLALPARAAASSAASTTTRGPRSSSTPRAREGQQSGARRRRPLRRPRRAARRPADAGDRLRARASTGSLLALEAPGRPGRAEPAAPVAVVVGADPGATAERLRIATPCGRPGSPPAPSSAPRKLGKQLEAAARDGAHFAVIVGDELADGQVQLQGPRRRHAEARRGRRPRPRGRTRPTPATTTAPPAGG